MYQTIVVPVDGSPFSEQVLPLALAIARCGGGRIQLTLVHHGVSPLAGSRDMVTYAGIELAARRAERTYVDTLVEQVKSTAAVPARAVVLTDPVTAALTDYISRSRADLVVMATHGRGPLRRAWLGSVADRLVRTLRMPVLLVRPREQESGAPQTTAPRIARVLVPLDGSPLGEGVLAPAVGLAKCFDAELALVQVVAPQVFPSIPLSPIPSDYDPSLTDLRRREAEDYLSSVAERLRKEGSRVTVAAVLGVSVAEMVLSLTRSLPADLIALATHGAGGLRRFVLGSVADKVIRAAECPVLAVRPSAPSRVLARDRAHMEPSTTPERLLPDARRA